MSDEKYLEVVMENEARLTEERIKAIRKGAAASLLKPIGVCHDCGESFSLDDPNRHLKLFCDDECAKSWEEWLNAQKRKHGPNFVPTNTHSF